MKNLLQKITLIAILLFVLQIGLTAQPVGSQIKTDTNGHISYWNGISAWIPVAPGLTGQNLQFIAGVPSWVNNPLGIKTTAVNSIIGNDAISGGIILSDGGAKITARGVCWSTTPNPTIADAHTTNGSGIGSFVSNINNLIPNVNYYIRAYATNSVGTAYGDEIGFIVPFQLRQQYQGGGIFYLLAPGDLGYDPNITHGLIDAGITFPYEVWGCSGTSIPGAVGTSIGTGYQNTLDIVNGCPDPSAARVCYNLIHNGYSDWYLPSKDELVKLFVVGNWVDYQAGYWSSSQYDNNQAWGVHFFNGNSDPYAKYDWQIFFRAIRSF